jgi:hypothetical protein
MPRTAEDVETYLLELNRQLEKRSETTFVVPSGGTAVVVHIAPPIVALRVTIGPVPNDAGHQVRMFRKLLELNATDLMHASYGIEDGTVVLSAALPIDNLDRNELEVTLSDIDLALARHIPSLHQAALE